MMLTHISISHRKYGLGSQSRWYSADVGKPALGAIAVVILVRFISPHIALRTNSLLFFGAVTVLAGAAAIASAPAVRALAVTAISAFFERRVGRER